MADSVFIVGMPIVCLLLLIPLAKVFSSESIWVTVMAFGAVGHHMPGFIRAYGDRNLFNRFRARFLIAPPLFFIATFSFSLNGLHGVALISMAWSIWHGMMQHFGFMRIYDAKAADPRRPSARISARLDFWMAASWFGLCLTYSPNQSGSLFNAMYQAGFGTIPPAFFGGLKFAAVAAATLATLAYLAWIVIQRRRGESIAPIKLALLVSTTGLVWFARVLTVDPFLSVALFELLHDIQYLAIVWAFNRNLVRKGIDQTRHSRALFGPRLVNTLIYVGVCLAYGSIGMVTYSALPEDLFKKFIVSALVTSGLLHFYYDGFIWKIRQPETRQGLDVEPGTAVRPLVRTGTARSLLHAVLFIGFVLLLLGLELRKGRPDALSQAHSMVGLIPHNPTSQAMLGMQLMERGQREEAVTRFEKALSLYPGYADARAKLGEALIGTDRTEEGIQHLRSALKTKPSLALAQAELGDALMQIYRSNRRDPNQMQEALEHLQRSVKQDPTSPYAQHKLGLALITLNRGAEAFPHFEQAAALAPQDAEILTDYGAALYNASRIEEAIQAFRRAVGIDPNYTPARDNLQQLTTPRPASR